MRSINALHWILSIRAFKNSESSLKALWTFTKMLLQRLNKMIQWTHNWLISYWKYKFRKRARDAILIIFFFVNFIKLDFAEVRGITNRKTVLEGYENVQAALLDYTLTCYPSVTVSFICVFLLWYPKHWNWNWNCFRINLVSCSVLYLKSTQWPLAVRSISTWNTVLEVRPHRRYLWKCYTPSGNNFHKIHTKSSLLIRVSISTTKICPPLKSKSVTR